MESDLASSILDSVATLVVIDGTTFRLNLRSKNGICNNVYSQCVFYESIETYPQIKSHILAFTFKGRVYSNQLQKKLL
jgi:hypothetical protein